MPSPPSSGGAKKALRSAATLAGHARAHVRVLAGEALQLRRDCERILVRQQERGAEQEGQDSQAHGMTPGST